MFLCWYVVLFTLLLSCRLKIVAFIPSLTAIVDCCVVFLFSTDMFNFMKMDDPFLGNGTFGQLARFGPERCAVMHVLLSDLESGGWKEKPEFKRYQDAYATLAGEKETDYIDKATGVFFRRFRDVINTHLVTKWTSTDIVQYVLGGDSHHAREFARWIVHHKSKSMNTSEEAPPVESAGDFSFDKRVVTLGKHHSRYHGDTVLDVEIDLQESMNFITKNADPLVILDDPFIKRNWAHIESLATESAAANVWDKSSTSYAKYKDFRLDVIHSVCIHSSHQQRCENYVQLCGLLSTTGVGEVRRTCRAIMNSLLHRRFNRWVLPYANKIRQEAGKKEVKRVEGAEKMTLFPGFAKEFFKNADNARALHPHLWKSVRDGLKDGTLKASNKEQLSRMGKFRDNLTREPKNLKALQPMGIEQTVLTLGAVKLSIFMTSNSKYFQGSGMTIDGLLRAEFEARGIEFTSSASLIMKRKAIQQHEFARILTEENPNKAVTLSAVVDFIPQSDRMKDFLRTDIQQTILSEKRR